jgi:hypothetical protein
MKSEKIRQKVGRLYDRVETMLWALMIASIVFFIAFILPEVPDIRANIVSTRGEEIAVENADLCERLGIKPGTREHEHCLIEVGAFRLKVEQRVDDEYNF